MSKNYFPDDEEIWEELLYFLKNPISKDEELTRKKAEAEYIDSVLEKAFSDTPQRNNVSKEPYLSYEDLLSPQEALAYKQNTLNKQTSVGHFVQQNNLQPSNLVEQKNNELQGFENGQKKKSVISDFENTGYNAMISKQKISDVNSNSPKLYAGIEKNNLTFLENVFDKLLQNQKNIK